MTDFNLLTFAQGKSRAETSVTLYFNEAAANRAQLALDWDESTPPEKYVKDREAFDAARAEVLASAVTVHLKGLDEGRVDEIRAEHEVKAGMEMDFNLSDEKNESYLIDVLVEAFDKAVSADGSEDTTPKSHDEWVAFKKIAPASQWPKLLAEVLNIIFVSFVIDEAVDAGFLADS
jgi:hypothetical protein